MTRSLPTVSVVIPVKDDAAFLRRCLAALAGQTVAPSEVIIVDNGSSDDSAQVAVEAGATVVHESTPGIAAASAAGYDRATGDLIARLDADSLPERDWIASIALAFDGRPDVDAFTGGAHFLDGPRIARAPAIVLYLGAYFVAASAALAHPPMFGSNFAMRRTAWTDVRGDVHGDHLIHDDFDLSFHLGERHRIRYTPGMRVGISMRPFFDGRVLLRTFRGLRTVYIHWPHSLPWLRAFRRLRQRLAGSAVRPTVVQTGDETGR